MLVDYEGMVNTVLKGRFIQQEAFLPLGFLGAIAYNPFSLNVEKAKALLAEAGYPNGFELEFTTPNQSAVDRHRAIGAADDGAGRHQAQASCRSSSSRCCRSSAPASTRCVLNSWAPDYFDPHSNADTFAHNDDDSDTPKIKPLAWRTHWYIPDLTKQTLAAAKEIDTEKRKAEYAALQKTVTDDGAVHDHVPERQPGRVARQRQRLQDRALRGLQFLSHDHEVRVRPR